MKSENYTEALKALSRAEEALANAEYDLHGGFVLATANRAYYSCYYCITALLYTQDIYTKTHQGARAKFYEIFVKTEIFSKEISDAVAILYDCRQQADYDLEASFLPQDAATLIEKARLILQLTQQYFNKNLD